DRRRLQRWLGPIHSFIESGELIRGLPELRFNAVRFMSKAFQPLLATEEFAFVGSVRVESLGGGRAARFAALPGLAYVSRLDLTRCPLGDAGSTALAGSPYLTGLRELKLTGTQTSDAGLAALASNPALARLRLLYVGSDALGDAGIMDLAGSPYLRRLE